MLKKTVLQIILLFATVVVNAQIPDIIPSGKAEPIEITPLNIVLYIVSPIVIFIIYIWYRKFKRKNKKK
jgi:hypothetical protein